MGGNFVEVKMGEKATAIYLMVRRDELTEADQGSYERPLARQKEDCLAFIKQKFGEESNEPVEIYANQSQLLMDVERNRIKRLVVHDLDRLGATQEDREGMLFEMRSAGIEVLSVNEE